MALKNACYFSNNLAKVQLFCNMCKNTAQKLHNKATIVHNNRQMSTNKRLVWGRKSQKWEKICNFAI